MTRTFGKLAAAALAAALVAGCATRVPPVEVTRFHRLDPANPAATLPPGPVSVAVRALPGDMVAVPPGAELVPGSIEARTYTAAVARELNRLGFSEAGGGAPVTATVSAQRYVGAAAERRSPVSVGVGGAAGSYGSGVGLGIGIDLSGPPKARVLTEMQVSIARTADGLVLWEGRARTEAREGSPAAQPGLAADKLARALLKDFPGRSGATITVP